MPAGTRSRKPRPARESPCRHRAGAAGRLLLLSLALLALLAWAASSLRIQRIQDREMAPSLRPGDWVLLAKGRPGRGDVVRIEDPAQPGRTVFRRVIATGGQRVGLRGGMPVVDGRASTWREMGRDELRVVLSEAGAWLVQREPRADRTRREAVLLAPGEAYLLADDRDLGTDSRWWGPVALPPRSWKVLLRAGPGDAWRGLVARGARDGPWERPSPSKR